MKRFIHYIQYDQMDCGPTCKNCARLHLQVEELASQVPLSLLLLTFPGSQKGKQVAQTVLATYRTRGWQQALDVLTCWYERGELPPGAAKPEQEDADRWERQQLYGLIEASNLCGGGDVSCSFVGVE